MWILACGYPTSFLGLMNTPWYLRSWCLDDHACRDDDHLYVCGADVGISFLGPLNVAASMGRSGSRGLSKIQKRDGNRLSKHHFLICGR